MLIANMLIYHKKFEMEAFAWNVLNNTWWD